MAQAQKSVRLGKGLMTIGIGIFTFIPPMVDLLTPTHIFNPDWVAHARFHTMWAIFSASAVGLLALWFLWREAGGVRIAGAIGSCVLGAFMLATLTMPLYGGALSDSNGVQPIAGMIDGNLLTFAVAFLLILTGWRIAVRGDDQMEGSSS